MATSLKIMGRRAFPPDEAGVPSATYYIKHQGKWLATTLERAWPFEEVNDDELPEELKGNSLPDGTIAVEVKIDVPYDED